MKLTDNEKREVLKLIEAGRPLPPVISTCEAGRNLYCLKQDFSPQSGLK
ncbi:MAG: hypothetical protein HXY38_14790 [Chloroflexi bacterium]|nr:hypothetical protein [Chloroflexota bacterium]